MKTTTFEMKRLQTRAIQTTSSPDLYTRLRKWWSAKYKLPPNHPLLLSRSARDLMAEMLEDYAETRADIQDELKANPSHPNRVELYRRLEALEVALGLRVAGQFSDDPVVEAWEQALEDGRELEGLNANVHPLILAQRNKKKEQPRPLPYR